MLKKLYLRHFRSYTEAEIDFSPGVNWIFGKNAQGKTNLLEAIYLLSTGRSFRTHQLNQLIQEGASFFFIKAYLEQDGVEQVLKLSFDGKIKKLEYNANTYSSFTPLIGLLPQVLYSPEDISLIIGAPSYRRKFLDLQLSQASTLYLQHLVRYYKALKQRNHLLKEQNEKTLTPWEITLAQSAAYLIQKRKALLLELQIPFQKKMGLLSADHDPLSLSYHNSIGKEEVETILEELQKNRKKELRFGSTLSGPHRDDVHFLLNDLPAKFFASQGQKHCAIAALKLCQWEHLQKNTNRLPFFCIDDFGIHLDKERKESFQEKIQQLGQIFLTSPNPIDKAFPLKKCIEVTLGNALEISYA